MFRKEVISSLCAIFFASHSFADTVQVLDETTTKCLNEAFNAIEMPMGHLDTANYGEIAIIAPINSHFSASINIYSQLNYGAPKSIEHMLRATVFWHQPSGYEFIHSQSIGISLNENGELVHITQGGYRAEWNVSGYASYTHALENPQYTQDQKETIREWISAASQTMGIIRFKLLNR